MSPLRRFVASGLACATVAATLVAGATAAGASASGAVTMTATPATVLPGNTLDLVAAMPVAGAGTVAQEIVMQIDPTKVKLTSVTDIKAPAGWTITYCSTACNAPPTNFSATVPGSAAAWAAVKAVRAVGNVDSQGEYQGKQLAARTSTIPIPATGPFASSGAGDGWSVFFDDRGYVFNIFHHNTSNTNNVDCRDRNGVSCGSNWPYGSGTGNGMTSYVSNGWYDPVYQHIWYDATRKYEIGFECVDVSDIAKPQPCGGNAGSTFVAAGISKSPIAGTPNFGSFNTWQTRGIVAIGGRIFSQSDGGDTPKVICVDTQANGGLGAKCPGSPFDPTPGQLSQYIGAVLASGGKLWVTSSNTTPRGGISCFDPATLQLCSAAWPKTWSMGAASQLFHLFEIPTAAGGVGGICATTSNCYSTSGSTVALNAGLATWYDGVGDAFSYAEHALRQGSRLYRGNGNGASAGAGSKVISCWDQSLNSGAGAVCPNWPIAVTNYAIALDPLNDNCLWKNDHQNAIRAYDARTATVNCLTPPSRVVIPAETAVPRMACATAGSGVREWRSIKLLAPSASGYTAASLTIIDSAGQEIAGWTNVAFGGGSRTIDLASLSVVATGQKPTFVVQYAGLTSATNTSVEVVAVGDAPELCLRPQALASCPVITGPGLQPNSAANGSFVVLGDGSATTGSGSTPYTQGTTLVTVGAGPSPTCAATLAGSTLSNDANTLPIVGATVALLDSAGNALTYPTGHPQAGQAITAVTDANGDYSFSLLAVGTYKVKFVNTAAATVQNSRMIASTAGPGVWSDFANATGSGAARTAISPATSISTAATGVVNAYFSVGPTAPSRNATALANTAVAFNPFVTDGASSAATPSSSSTFSTAAKALTRLCDPTTTPPQNGTTVACTLTSRAVTGQGTWTVNTNSSSADPGKITFTPLSSYSGTATPMTYSVTDVAGQTAAGSLTPTIIGGPTASADLSSGAFNTAQTITPLANDAAAAGASLTVSSVRLCAVSPVKNPPNCDDTTVTVSGQGTYTVNASGVVTFTPLSSFFGTATAMRYQVSDSVGQVANSTITPTVTAPPAVTANANTTSGGQGASQSANLLTNDVAPLGVTLVASSVRLCGPPSPFTCDDTTVTIGGVGTYTVNAIGVVTFTPLPGYTGTPTALGYQVTDSVGRNVTSTYTPTVVPRPNADDDTSTGPYGQAQTIAVLADDTAGAGTSLVTSSVRLCGTGDDSTAQGAGGCDDTTLTTAAGTYTVNANGSVSFAPAPGFSGTAPPVAYQVADGLGQKDAGTITVTVTPLVGPNAGDDTLAVRPGGSATFDSITAAGGLATPGDGSLVSSSTCLVDPTSVSVPKACDADDSVGVPGVGTWSLNRTTGVVTFTADSNAAPGASGSVDYRVIDANVQSAEGTLTALIPPAPVAVDDTSYGEQGRVQVLLPTGNDVPGIASAPMKPASVRLCGGGQPPGCDKTSLTVAEGTYAVNPTTGAVTFTPVNDAFYGTVTPVAYQVADSTGQVGTAQLRPVVLPRPAPRAVDDTGLAPYGQDVTLVPLGNDDSGSIPPDDTSISGLTLNASSLRLCGPGDMAGSCDDTTVTTVDGTYTLAGSTVTFAPATGFSGTVTAPVQYQVSNSYTQTSQSKSQTGTAYLIPSIGAPTPPSASNDSAVGLVNSAVTLSPLANDSAGQRFALVPGSLRLCGADDTAPNCTATTVSVTGKGTFTLNPATGAVTFVPLPDWTGAASVPYVVADAGGAVVSANLQVTVNAPVAADDTSYGRPGVVQAISVLGNDSPAAGTGTSLVGSTVRLCGPGQAGAACDQTSTTTAKGTYAVDDTGVVRFTPVPGFVSGDDSVSYSVRDSAGQVASAVIRPSVVSPPAPTAVDDSGYAPVGQSVTFSPWTNDASMGNRTQGTVSYTSSGLTQSSVRLCGPGDAAGSCDDTTVTTADGTYVVNTGTGVVTFTPVAGFTGTAAFPVGYEIGNPYTWTDSSGSGSGTQVAAATLTPVVVAPPTPSAVDDTGYAGFGQPVSFSPWTNDSAMGNRTQGTVTYTDSGFTHASVRLCGAGDSAPNCDDTTVTTTDGTYVVNAGTGVVTFTPVSGFTGPAAPVPYQIDNPYAATNSGNPAGTGTQIISAQLAPTIGPLTPPTATDDSATTAAGTPVTLDAGTDDVAGTYPLVPSSVRLCDDTDVAPNCSHTTLVLPGQGTFVANSSGVAVFTPEAGWSGTVSVPYSIADTQGTRDDAILTVIVTAPAPPPGGGGGGGGGGGTPSPSPSPTPTPSPSPGLDPVPEPDQGLGRPGEPVRIDPIGNDTPGQGQSFDEGSLRLCPAGSTPPACTGLVVPAPQGTWVVDPFTGVVVFTPVEGFKGKVEIPYVIETDDGDQVDSVITVWITGPPAATDDASTGKVNTPQTLSPLGNDAADAAPWVASTMRLCAAGQVPAGCDATEVTTPDGVYRVDPATGKVIFTPAIGFTGDAIPIQYQVADEAGQVADAWLRPRVAGGGDAQTGWLHVRKVITKGADVRTGQVKLVTVCTGDTGQTVKRTHVMDTGTDRDTWRVRVPAGMTCKVHERAHGAPTTPGMAPMWDSRRWQVGHTPSIDVGEKVPVGTATAIDRLILSAKGGCEIVAGELVGVAVGTCIVTWRAPGASVTTTTRWTHTTARATRTGEGTLTRAIPITGGSTTRVTFTNAYDARAHVVTRTVYVTDPCAPIPKIRPRYAGTDPVTNPGTCS